MSHNVRLITELFDCGSGNITNQLDRALLINDDCNLIPLS